MNEADKKVEEIKSFAISSENLFTDVKTVLEKHWKDFKEILDKKNIARKECLLLPFRALAKIFKKINE